MPRSARKLSATNIYHIICRGINKQNIFEDDEDRITLLYFFRDCMKKHNGHMYAYCLMSNHIHVLIKIDADQLAIAMKRIGIRYARYYNEKYGRVGHLFQDRYKSEPVEDERYFLTVLRYIIQNPMRAGMEDAPGKYPWTSFGAYLGHYDAFTETDLAISIGGGKESLVEFLMEKNEDSAMEVKNSQRFLSDHESKKVMLSLTGCQTVSEFQNLPSDIQKEYFVQLYNSGISMAQIGRMTGRSKTLVHRAIRG